MVWDRAFKRTTGKYRTILNISFQEARGKPIIRVDLERKCEPGVHNRQ